MTTQKALRNDKTGLAGVVRTMAATKHAITLIPGDGIGPEVSAAVVRILEQAGAATGVAFEWHKFAAGTART